MAEEEQKLEITRSELSAALKQWDTDAKANGWKERDDDARFDDSAEYLLHTIRLARGDDGLRKEQ